MAKGRVVICGSMALYAKALEIAEQLKSAGLEVVVPQPDDWSIAEGDTDAFERWKLAASRRHIRKIRDTSTFAILVANLDRHGIADYIGPNAFAEIAVALAHYKRIYLYQGIPDLYEEELVAWGAIPLHGDINRLIADHREDVGREGQQLQLFDGPLDG